MYLIHKIKVLALFFALFNLIAAAEKVDQPNNPTEVSANPSKESNGFGSKVSNWFTTTQKKAEELKAKAIKTASDIAAKAKKGAETATGMVSDVAHSTSKSAKDLHNVASKASKTLQLI
ncbi:hypothetical protein NEFER03_1858 [Nematocida sp. LUAm3]|nr:hypothetical protein NEFER03_1858 [Nematocida sp. LUAm3]KAI5173992.1 hypothetical protein NEFER02_0459 [Nematocida sp. LUAm2]KAI5177264.1 hypothetical protein NEFER01_0539 [Nematocida sp. LUAm1]